MKKLVSFSSKNFIFNVLNINISLLGLLRSSNVGGFVLVMSNHCEAKTAGGTTASTCAEFKGLPRFIFGKTAFLRISNSNAPHWQYKPLTDEAKSSFSMTLIQFIWWTHRRSDDDLTETLTLFVTTLFFPPRKLFTVSRRSPGCVCVCPVGCAAAPADWL